MQHNCAIPLVFLQLFGYKSVILIYADSQTYYLNVNYLRLSNDFACFAGIGIDSDKREV